MKPDPIVEEIHETRQKIWDECDGDMNRLIERLRKSQEKHPERIITKEEFDRRRQLKAENAG